MSAYDISGSKYPILVEKAVELAEILYTAFDTPNRMPTPHYTWSAYVSLAPGYVIRQLMNIELIQMPIITCQVLKLCLQS